MGLIYCRGKFFLFPPTYRSALGHASPCMELLQVALFLGLKDPEHEGDILGLGDSVGILTLSPALLRGGLVFGHLYFS